jgi:hypothetical protein
MAHDLRARLSNVSGEGKASRCTTSRGSGVTRPPVRNKPAQGFWLLRKRAANTWSAAELEEEDYTDKAGL